MPSTRSMSDPLALSRPPRPQEADRTRANWEHWEGSAHAFGADYAASWGDRNAIELEIATLLRHLQPSGRWLDAGCANGYTTFRTLLRQPDDIHAFDFSSAMIEHARRAQPRHDPQRKISFSHGNILEIHEPDDSIDQAWTVRVLINLPSWEAQQQALREMHRVLKPGGRYILSEAFTGSQRRLNAVRALADLPPLAPPEFNLYLEESPLEDFLADLFDIVAIDRFSSLYYVASRLLRELTVEPNAPPDYNHPINSLAAALGQSSRSGDFGIQKAYILVKS